MLEIRRNQQQQTDHSVVFFPLRAEQRAAAEVDYVTFKRILTPLQGASLILTSFPVKADAVGLGQAVKKQMQEAS